MIRFGVCSLAQLYANRLEDVFGKQKSIAIELYEQLHRSQLPAASDYQEIVLDRFKFEGVFKRTHRSRFGKFDRATVSAVREHLGDSTIEALSVHDLAVSDGRTSVDLYQQLRSVYGDKLRFLASDILPWVHVVSGPKERLKIVTDDSGKIMELFYPPFVFNLARQESKFYWINHIARQLLLRRASFLSALFVQRSTAVHATKIWLLHKDCRELAEHKGNFTFDRYNIFEPIDQQFDIVRAMNILNPSYFNRQEIHRTLCNVFSSLRVGGLFVTGSNEGQGSEVAGGIYVRTANGFRRVFRSCSGSNVDDLIAGFN
jgi:hypothetical protein